MAFQFDESEFVRELSRLVALASVSSDTSAVEHDSSTTTRSKGPEGAE